MATTNPITVEDVRAAVAKGDLKRASDLLAAVLRTDADCGWAYVETIELLRNAGHLEGAADFARRGLARLPDDARLHEQFANLLSEDNELVAGEWHFRRALELGGRSATVLAGLALNLMRQGRPGEAEPLFAEADGLAPNNVQLLAYWSKTLEVQHDLDGAQRLLARAAAAGSVRDVDLLQAQYLARTGRARQALATLDAAPVLNGDALLERGRLRDRAGRHAEAWSDFVAGKQALARAAGGLKYEAAAVTQFFDRMAGYFSRGNYARLPRARRRSEVAQPIFVLGFPRSGTTLLEQILAAHPSIRAGGELRFVKEWRDLVNQLLSGRGPFPLNLQECVVADRRHIATLLRDHYLARAEQMGLLVPGAAFFVDKMPFNEVSLPLIRMAFPEAPIVHVVRHPLDVCVSMMSHHFKHGFHCGYRLEDIGHHLSAVHRLHEHYRRELEPGEIILRYETLVANPRPLLGRLFAHLGVPFDDAVLRFYESGRYAPTPSYAQVAEPLNDRSIGRYRHYGRELEPVRPVVEPLIAAWDRLD